MLTSVIFKLLPLLSALQAAEATCSQTFDFSEPDASEGWCQAPLQSLQIADPILEAEVDGAQVEGVAIVPDPVNSRSGFLKGFVISYSVDRASSKWHYLKGMSGTGSLYAIRYFKGATAEEMQADSSTPYYRMFVDSIQPLFLRIHVLVHYPLNAPCMEAEVQTSQCTDIPAFPVLPSPPTCGEGHHLQLGYCARKVFCPPGWVLQEEDSDCYYFDGLFQTVSFDTSQNLCSPNSLLVLTKPAKTLSWISEKLKEMTSTEAHFWIGLYARKGANGYTWLWLQDQHSTEELLTLDTTFLPEVTASSSEDTCVVLLPTGALAASNCSLSNTFICSKPKVGDLAAVCPQGWNKESAMCYYFSPPVLKGTWQYARHMCESMDSVLLDIINEDSWDWIKGQVESLKTRRQTSAGSSKFWVGAKGNSVKQLEWISSVAVFTGLSFPEKQALERSWNCASMKPDDADGISLEDNDCSATMLPFVCESTDVDIPIQGMGSLKYVDVIHLTHDQAQGHCLKLGGNLVSFHTDVEFTKVTYDLEIHPEKTWIYGLKSVGLGQYKYWMDDTEVDFTAWTPSQPFYDPGQRYVYGIGFLEFRWESLSFEMKKPFVCKLQKHTARRLISGYYAVPDVNIQSNQYLTEDRHASYFANSAINSRIGSERFFRLNDDEVFVGCDGYKPSIAEPLSLNQPFLQASFDEFMVIEALILKNIPYEAHQAGTAVYYAIEYSSQNDLLSYSESAGFTGKQIFDYLIDYDYELLIELKVPILTSVISLSLVYSNTAVQHGIQWDVIGYPADDAHPVDLCELVIHGCSHDCIVTLSSYKCSCPSGYHLFADGKNCIPDAECHGGYKKIEGGCFMIDDSNKTHEKAKRRCKEDGATLMSIHSKTEMELIRRDLDESMSSRKKYIIGLQGTNVRMGRWDDGTWVDVEYFGVAPPENPSKSQVVFLDRSKAWSWNVKDEKSTKGGFICKQLKKDCHVPLLSGPVSVSTEFTASSQQSGTKASIDRELVSFVHDPNTDESPVWLQISFQETYMVTGITYSAGERLGVEQFTVAFSSDGVNFESFMDKFGAEARVFTFPSPPSSLTYVPVIPPVNATHVRIVYDRPDSNSERIGIAFEVYGCPSDSRDGPQSFCGSSSVGYKHLHTDGERLQYHCLHQCSNQVVVDNSGNCDTSSCQPNPCQNGGTCKTRHGGFDCECATNFDGPQCENGITSGLQLALSTPMGNVNTEFYVAVLVEIASSAESFVVKYGDGFQSTVKSSKLTVINEVLSSQLYINSGSDFLEVYRGSTLRAYLTGYSYLSAGEYRITVRTTVSSRAQSDIKAFEAISSNPCITSVTLTNLESSFTKKQTFMENMAIQVITSVHTQCEGRSVRTQEWQWDVHNLTESSPLVTNDNQISLPETVFINRSSLLMPANTLRSGQYGILVHLRLVLEPDLQELRASASGFVDMIEPTHAISIMGGSRRIVSTQAGSTHLEAIVTSFIPGLDLVAEVTSYTWQCTQYRPGDPTNDVCDFSIPMSGTTLQGFTEKSLELDSDIFSAGTDYTITVRMEIGPSYLSHSQVLSVTDEAIPDMSITCVINCGNEVNAAEKITLLASCFRCDAPSELNYQWRFSPISDSNLKRTLLWGMDTATRPNQNILVIKADVLLSGESYTISLSARKPNGPAGYAEIRLDVAEKLVGGQCEVTPGSGLALSTEFTLSCQNFPSNAALLYTVYLLEPGTGEHKWSLLSEGYKSDISLHFLPAGQSAENYVQSLVVAVKSSSGASVNVTTTVQVQPVQTGAKLSVLQSLIVGDNTGVGALDKLVMLGSTRDALGLLNSVVPELNTVSDGEGTRQAKQELREKLMNTLTTVKQDSVGVIKQTSFMVDSLLQNRKEVTSKIKEDAGVILDGLTSGFKELATKSTPKDAEETAGFIFGGISRLMDVVVSEAEEISGDLGSTETLEKAKNLTGSALEGLDSVLDSISIHLIPGEEASRFVSDTAILTVEKNAPDNMAGGQFLDSDSGVGFAMPSAADMPAIGSNVTEIIVKMMVTHFNPFPWGSSEFPINKSSISISLQDQAKEDIILTNLTNPVDVFIPINKNEGENSWSSTFQLKVPYRTETGEVIKNLTEPRVLSVTGTPNYSTILKATTSYESVLLAVLIKLGIPVDSVDDFFADEAEIVTLPKAEEDLETHNSLTTDKNSLYFPSNVSLVGNWTTYPKSTSASADSNDKSATSDFTSDGTVTYHLAIIPKIDQIVNPSGLGWTSECVDSSCEFSVAYLNVTVEVLRGACLYWSEESEEWTSEGCVSTMFSTTDQIHCWCSHLSVFSVSIFVLPNLVDPISEISLFLTFFDNPLVVSLVIGIWYLYFMLLIWTRHKDKEDEALTGVTVLADNDSTNTYLYLVGVTTGWWRGAGTTANVFISLDGTQSQSLRHALLDDRRKRFAKGAEDWFLLTTPQSLGVLESLSIWHDNSGSSPAWYLNDIVVQDLQTEESWSFIYTNWLAMDRGNLQVIVELPAIPATEIQRNKARQFSKMSSQNMRDGHLWFSIFAKPMRSKFTRAQRLSCALVLLLTAMLTNLMFHGIPTDDPKDQVSGQGLVISLSSIVIGVETALIMFPINFIIVQLFLKLKPRAVKGDRLKFIDRIEPSESETRHEETAEAKKSQTPGILPWWFVYISWTILILVALVTSFFVMLYGLKYGYSKSVKWAVSFFTAFLTSALVTQPLKVIGVAMLITMILKKYVSMKYQTDDAELMATIDKEKEYSGGEALEENAEAPSVSRRAIRAIKERVLMEWRMHDLWKELALYFSFVAVVLIVAHGHRNVDTCYLATRSVEDMFIQGNYHGMMPFTKVSTVDDLWQYVEDVFLPSLYSTSQDTNSSSSYPPLTADRVSVAVGLPRIRQIRKQSGDCLGMVRRLPAELGGCASLETYTSEDTTSYNGSWNRVIGGSAEPPDQWTYQTAWSLETIPYWGKYSSYSGGGYVVEIPDTHPSMQDSVNLMKDTAWVDERTMAVFIELSVYNPSTNLFSVIMMLFEFSGPGRILPFHQIFTCKMYHYGNDFETFVAVCEVLFILITVALTYYEVKRLLKVGRTEYFREAWNYAEMLTVILCITAIALYFQRTVSVSSAIDEYRKSEGRVFVNFYTAAVWDFTLGYVLAFLVMLVILKVIRLFRFNKRMTIFGLTLRLSANPLSKFFTTVIVYFIAFAHFSCLVFGSILESYRDFLTTSQTLCNFAIGVSDFLGLQSASRVIGPIFFFVFVFLVQMLLINMFLAILMDSFTEARQTIDQQKNEYELVEFIWGYFLLALGIHKRTKTKNKQEVENVDGN